MAGSQGRHGQRAGLGNWSVGGEQDAGKTGGSFPADGMGVVTLQDEGRGPMGVGKQTSGVMMLKGVGRLKDEGI